MSTITATVTTTITTIPLLRHRDTVVNFPADQDDFVAKYEATNDHLSVSTVPQINAVGDQIDIITGQINVVIGEINANAGIATTQAGIATTQAGIATTQAGIAVAAVASLPVGTLNDSLTTLTNTWSATKISGELATKLNLSGGNLTGALNTARATVASHATTSDIWGALGNQIDFTGTATVTAFPNAPQAGAERTLICAGACSFTAGANMIIDGVPSGTVLCAVNDKINVRAVSTTTFNLTRTKADGTPQVSAAGGSMIYLSTVNASAASTADIEVTLDSTYDRYVLEAVNVSITADHLQMLFKIGGSYVTTGYSYVMNYTQSSNAVDTRSSRTSTSDSISSYIRLTNGANIPMNFTCTLSSVHLSVAKQVYISGVASSGEVSVIGHNSNTATLTGVRFRPSGAGTISGTFRLYGIKNS